ncbi:GNAT family N-acetyltransferase [Acidaminobacter sp. JC074]|uniref:GNAT family N-acetyltransferase n=1 Tax=Acidaminobacter sp. JC074 TaxID=2530199 RepID=UPI001F0CE722|nr:GNAT family protein [Acidaminobacter sp. JC074]MCH4887259.1 GNAT family N-acetyltransferase [Acidaminobacter sp. JC074]
MKLINVDPDRYKEYHQAVTEASESCYKYTGGQMNISLDQAKAYLERIAGSDSRRDYFMIDNDKIIGEVVLNEMDGHACNIRIAIFNEKDQNKGYGRLAMKEALRVGFEELKLHRIELSVYDFNKRGIHVYKSLGFVEEGVLRDAYKDENGYHDEIIMSILETEFKG